MGSQGAVGYFDLDDYTMENRRRLADAIGSSCALIVFIHVETCHSERCRFEWQIAKAYDLPVLCIANIDNCPKSRIIEQISQTQPYLLASQIVEYTPSFRKVAIQKVIARL